MKKFKVCLLKTIKINGVSEKEKRKYFRRVHRTCADLIYRLISWINLDKRASTSIRECKRTNILKCVKL